MTIKDPSVNIVCIAHEGEIELKTSLLVYSLKKNSDQKAEITVCIPEINGVIRWPDKIVLDFLKTNEIKVRTFKNDYFSNKPYKLSGDIISNKIYGLFIPDSDFLLFLDSDIICFNQIVFKKDIFKSPVSLRYAFKPTVTKWPQIYEQMELSFPEKFIEYEKEKIRIPPYFNSGVVLIAKNVVSELKKTWISFYNKLSEPELVNQKLYNPFFRDQIALSLALQKLDLNYNIPEETFNFPLRIRKGLTKQIPTFVHYHDILTILDHESLKTELLQFLKTFPEFNDVVKKYKIWDTLLNSSAFQKKIIKFKSILRRNLNTARNLIYYKRTRNRI